jgi:nucleoside-diphosphate-sugar epimerase
MANSLAAAGAHVRVLDALISQHGGDERNIDPNLGSIDVVIGNIADQEVTRKILTDVDFIFNIAGQVSHHESMIDPLRDTDINVTSQLKFLESIRQYRSSAVVVHTSTRQVYGTPQYLPVDEQHPTVPRDINGVNKLAGENYHRLYGTVHGVRTVSLRLSNVFGPGQSLQKTGLGFLPVFLARAMKGLPLEVFGDGQQQRDCLYVTDVVEALGKAALQVAASAVDPGEVINLGHTEVLSLLQIAEIVVSRAGQSSTISCIPWPEELARIDIGGFSGDYAKAHRLLNWTPQVAFADGIEQTLDFYRRYSWYL